VNPRVSIDNLQIRKLSSQQGQQIFLFSKSFRPALQPMQPPPQWTLGFFPRGKAAGA
jgi:hypothetical protein